MATTKLVSKTLGKIFVQSGEGSPDHSETIGSLYTDTLSGTLYIYKLDIGWVPMNSVTYGHFGFQDNTGTTSMTTGWQSFPSLLISDSIINGVELSGDTSKIKINRDGNYVVKASAAIFSTVADANAIRVGIFHNGNITDIQSVGWIYQTTKQNCQIGLVGTINGVQSGDSIGLAIKSDTATASVICKDAVLFVKKKS